PPTSAWAPDHSMALAPSRSDSTSPTTPRATGTRRHRSPDRGTAPLLVTMAPSGFRTATAQVDAPRIITPPSTACPPYARMVAWLPMPFSIGRTGPQPELRRASTPAADGGGRGHAQQQGRDQQQGQAEGDRPPTPAGRRQLARHHR